MTAFFIKNPNFSHIFKNRCSTTPANRAFQKSYFSFFRKFRVERRTFFILKKIRKFLFERKVESKISKIGKFSFEKKVQSIFSKIGKYFFELQLQNRFSKIGKLSFERYTFFKISKIGKCCVELQTLSKTNFDALQPYSIKGFKMEFSKFSKGQQNKEKIQCSR